MATHEAHTTHVHQRAEWAEHRALVYRPLSVPGREIRLMHIEPADDYNADVHVRLSIANLDDGPTFHALSLTWGDPANTRKVYLEGFEYLVTTNQEDALRNMRRRPAYRGAALWMDVVCINQTDHEERRLMVGKMDQIYKASVRTIVWLGEPDLSWYGTVEKRIMIKINERLNGDGTLEDCARRITVDYEPFRRACEKDWLDGALWILDKLSQNVHFWEFPFFIKDERKEYGDYLCTSQWKMATSTLEKILRLPYWSRLWIIQELVLSPSMPEIHMGTRTIPLELFSTAAVNLVNHRGTCCKMTTPFWMVSDLIDSLDTIYYLNTMKAEYSKEPLNIYSAVLGSHGSSATDPRDRIYGVLGLVKESQRIPVDYRLSKFQVFAQYRWKMVDVTGSIDSILAEASRSRSVGGRPTWVNDWALPRNHSEHWSIYYTGSPRNWSQISANQSTDPKAYSCDTLSGILQVPGLRLDRVDRICYSSRHSPLWDQVGQFGSRELLQNETNFRKLMHSGRKKIEDGEYWEVIMNGRLERTNVSTVAKSQEEGTSHMFFSLGKPFTSAQCAKMEHLLDFLKAPGNNLTEIKKMGAGHYEALRQLDISLDSGSFFITEQGRIGSSEMNVRSGDEIFRLWGCGLPAVLRRWEPDGTSYGLDFLEKETQIDEAEVPASSQNADNDDYTVIAPCYISEFMGRHENNRELFDQMIILH